MARSPAVHGLIRKRAEIAGEIETLQRRFHELTDALDHLDATLRLFEPGIVLEDIRPKRLAPRHAAKHGEMARFIFEAIREAGEPLTCAQLADAFMAARQIDTSDKATVATIRKRVQYSLRQQRERGTLAARSGAEGLLVWEIAG